MTTLHSIYVGHDYGSDHPDAGDTIPNAHRTILGIVSRSGASATVFQATGFWNGAVEDTTVIQIIGGPEVQEIVHSIADSAKAELYQDAVMVTYQNLSETEMR